MSNRTLLCAGAVLSGMLVAQISFATIVDITTADGNGADALVDGNGSHATTNYGSAVDMGFRFLDQGAPNQRNERIYLRFELPSDIQTINSATLTITHLSTDTNKTAKLYGLTNESLDNWGETTITFNNAPAATSFTTQNPDASATVFIANKAINTEGISQITFPTSVELVNFLNTDSNGLVTFIISDYDNSQTYSNYATKENSTQGVVIPTLHLDYTPVTVPEPAALGLLALAMAGALRRRH